MKYEKRGLPYSLAHNLPHSVPLIEKSGGGGGGGGSGCYILAETGDIIGAESGDRIARESCIDQNSLIYGLIHYWNFEQLPIVPNAIAAREIDIIGTNHITIGSGQATISATGKVNQGLSTVYTSWVQTAGVDLSVGDFTIAGAFHDQGNGDIGIVSELTQSGTSQWSIYCYGATSRIYFLLSADGSNYISNINVPITIPSGWHTFIAWRDTAANLACFAFDTDGSAPVTASCPGSTPLHTPPPTLLFGAAWPGGQSGGVYIDEVGIWNRVLTPAERAYLFNAGNWRTYADFGPIGPTLTPPTWNGLDSEATLVLSNANKTIALLSGSAGPWRMARANKMRASGKCYCEFKIDTFASNSIFGLANFGTLLADYPGGNGGGFSYTALGLFWSNIANSSGPISKPAPVGAVAGDYIQMAVDFKAGKLWFGKNNVWMSAGDPAAGTNPIYTGVFGPFLPAIGFNTAGSQVTARFDPVDFIGTVPTGFSGF